LNLILLSFIWLAGLRLARDKQDAHLVLKDITIMFAAHIALTWCIQMASSIKHGTLDELLSNGLDDVFLQSFTLMAVFWTFKRVVVFTGSKAEGSATLRLLGDISYPLYLVHIPTFVVLKRMGVISPAGYVACAVGVSSLLYWAIDLYSQRRHLKGSAALVPSASAGGALTK
jgi:peptidoglycan/LPS O-acetylase OafA/YrhL